VAAALLTATVAGAAGPRPVVQAIWVAQGGTTMFRGNVSAQALPTSGNELVGSWTLADKDWAIVMQGTWSGKKSGRGWAGTWRAKVQAGGIFDGTWQAVPPAGFKGKTFEDLFRAIGDVQISGYWKTRGGTTGAWWLKPSPS
jgi:hypothetical protein